MLISPSSNTIAQTHLLLHVCCVAESELRTGPDAYSYSVISSVHPLQYDDVLDEQGGVLLLHLVQLAERLSLLLLLLLLHRLFGPFWTGRRGSLGVSNV